MLSSAESCKTFSLELWRFLFDDLLVSEVTTGVKGVIIDLRQRKRKGERREREGRGEREDRISLTSPLETI